MLMGFRYLVGQSKAERGGGGRSSDVRAKVNLCSSSGLSFLRGRGRVLNYFFFQHFQLKHQQSQTIKLPSGPLCLPLIPLSHHKFFLTCFPNYYYNLMQ